MPDCSALSVLRHLHVSGGKRYPTKSMQASLYPALQGHADSYRKLSSCLCRDYKRMHTPHMPNTEATHHAAHAPPTTRHSDRQCGRASFGRLHAHGREVVRVQVAGGVPGCAQPSSSLAGRYGSYTSTSSASSAPCCSTSMISPACVRSYKQSPTHL